MADSGQRGELVNGDYVLATKYDDGGPCDHFCVGFYAGRDRDRHFVVDSDGNQFRLNGFRRVEKITYDEGQQLVEMMPSIGDVSGPSLWYHLSVIRNGEPIEYAI